MWQAGSLIKMLHLKVRFERTDPCYISYWFYVLKRASCISNPSELLLPFFLLQERNLGVIHVGAKHL